ncbi:hypothetical protein [Aurantiacibacter sp. MUD61]|uniref:hypothetical protein n=1 Tax=Aurantiacibacter sp. MUD61 TaxID=3009083 RepID=UPI0022F0FB03|nr:hypothetical protein [Aurantiacibacter sp. MUD61]
MTMPHEVAQMRIVRDLRAAEEALDNALLRQSSLLTTMVEARRETGSAPFLGQEALLRLAKSQETLVSAGNDLARVHGNLLKVQADVVGYEGCPENEPMGQFTPTEAVA